ncbi:DMT family transporter [Cohnella hashimotonis]|uniref:DMT family transporter n=1 Tax=Cohnella hashimotonis TaxID=2826895 RepID=A0ABT6TH62_9BACL|nr:DMT family transporter [Cohnella hashimotonis]MDI4646055.1 DMT family transporter [Cohnella hashimotonis]
MNPISQKPPVAPAIPLLVGMIAISFAPILVRYSDAPVAVQGMWRMLFTLVLMLPFAGGKQLRALRAIKPADWGLLLAAGFFLALHFLLWMASLSYTSIASSTLILSLEPVFVMIGAYFLFGDRLSRKALAGLVAALIGIAIVGAGDSSLSGDALKGDLLSLLGTVAVAVNMLLAKRILERVPSFLYSLVVFAVTAFCFYLYNVGTGADMAGYPSREWLVFAGLAIVPTVFGHLIFNWLLHYVKPATISMSVLAEPVGASILGLILFGEAIGNWQLIGGAFVIAGLTLYMRSEAEAYDLPAEQAS